MMDEEKRAEVAAGMPREAVLRSRAKKLGFTLSVSHRWENAALVSKSPPRVEVFETDDLDAIEDWLDKYERELRRTRSAWEDDQP